MSALIEFLEARLAEDEDAARAATPGPWRHNPGKHYHRPGTAEFEESVFAGPPGPEAVSIALTGQTDDRQSMADAVHIARHDPTRVLREVAAKRAIVTEHSPEWRTVEWNHDQDGEGNAWVCKGCGNHDIASWQNWSPEPGEAWMPDGMKPPYVVWPCETIKHLAAVYSDHPDYDQSWSTT